MSKLQMSLFKSKAKKSLSSSEIKNSLRVIMHYIEHDPRSLVAMMSGGKDSTVIAMLIFRAMLILKRLGRLPKKTLYIITSDTMMELPAIRHHLDLILTKIKQFSKQHDFNVEVHRVKPEPSQTFNVLLIGKGYVKPDNQNNRWCTSRLKILPATAKLNEILAEREGVIMAVGSRADESVGRRDRLKTNTIDGFLKSNDNPNCNNLAPIEFWDESAVWTYIAKHNKRQWWCAYDSLLGVYAESLGSDKECRTIFEGTKGSENAGCKQNRHGCLICPLAQNHDRALQGMLDSGNTSLRPINRFRDWLMDVERLPVEEFDRFYGRFDKGGFEQHYKVIHRSTDEVSFTLIEQGSSWYRRDVYRHGLQSYKAMNRDNHRKHMNLPGGYTLAYRKEILRRLLEAEVESIKLGGEQLVQDFELELIQQYWLEDGDLDLSCVAIAKEVADRKVPVSDKFRDIIDLAKGPMTFIASYECDENSKDRYALQASKEVIARVGIALSRYFVQLLNEGNYDAETKFRSFDCNTKHYYPTLQQEEKAREEWAKDSPNIITLQKQLNEGLIKKAERTLLGFEGPAAPLAEVSELDYEHWANARMVDFYIAMDNAYAL